jgi:outer membrane protein OmpA-like peptidoglycan-associated protein
MINFGSILRSRFKICIALSVLLFFKLSFVEAQMVIKMDMSPEQIVNKILLNDSSGVAVSQVKYTGCPKSLGVFYVDDKILPFNKGVALSTGLVNNVDGPNESGRVSSERFTDGDKDLELLTGRNTSDAAVLEFSFIPDSDEVLFEYFFASEEYPEFINKGVNDVFVFSISGPGYDSPHNMANVPETGDPVTIDHINHLKNTPYFIMNKPWGDELSNYSRKEVAISYTFEYDGMTTKMVAKASVKPYYSYRLKIAIADVGDNLYDSGVFLHSKSFKSTGEKKKFDEFADKELLKLKAAGYELDYIKKQNGLILKPNIQFEFNNYEIHSKYYPLLDELATLLIRYFKVTITLVGHTDDVGSDDYNFELSVFRANELMHYLISKGVSMERIQVIGKGKSAPLYKSNSEKSKALNRRVEWHLSQ